LLPPPHPANEVKVDAAISNDIAFNAASLRLLSMANLLA
jgi:hypothetical protein